ncbi:MAG: PEGA domain-containing protein [Deltaproteobacteria bacterium]|nr:PEGA domain-containing protein [Deltaproteobacteria bacterium]
MKAKTNIKTTVSLIYFPEIERNEADIMTFIRVAQKNLLSYKGFEYIPLEILLDKKGFQAFFSDFRRALRHVQEGRLHYENMDFENSHSSFARAVQLFEKNNIFVNKQNLYIEALTYLGAIAVLSNKIDLAYNYFRQIVTADPKYKPDASLFPPQIIEVYNKVSREILNTSKCVVKFVTEPENAQIYLNGEFVGFSPIDKTGLICGNHYYYVLAAGYRPSFGSFQVTQDKIVKEVFETLNATDNLSLLDKIQTSTKQLINSDDYPPVLSFLSDIDQVIIVYVTGSRAKPLLVGILYDNIGKNKINLHSVQLNKPLSDSPKEIDNFITSVYLEIGGKRIITPAMSHLTSEEYLPSSMEKKVGKTETPKPLYRHWWFWMTIVGAAALLITIPVVLINTADSNQRDPNDHLDPFLRR